MKMLPQGRRVLVEMDKVEDTFKGSNIYRPNNVKEREQMGEYKGTVLAVGVLAWRDLHVAAKVDFNPWCKPGDRILFHSHSGARISDESTDRRILINDNDVLARIEDEDV